MNGAVACTVSSHSTGAGKGEGQRVQAIGDRREPQEIGERPKLRRGVISGA